MMKNIKQIFKWPFVIASLTAYGLIAALIEEGGFVESFATMLIAVSVFIIVYFYLIKR